MDAAADDERLPVHADGTLVHTYERLEDGGTYRHEKVFRSPDLAERYGEPTFRYRPEEVPAMRLPPEVRERERTTFRVRAQKVIGTHEEHRRAERRLRDRAADSPPALPDWDAVPLYHYKTEAQAEEAGPEAQAERQAPINVYWRSLSVEEVIDDMSAGTRGETWEKHWLGGPIEGWLRDLLDDGDHHIYHPGTDTPQSVDGDIAKSIDVCWFKQYHVRLYEIDMENAMTIGQAHRDPCLHNQEVETLNFPDDTPIVPDWLDPRTSEWKFQQSVAEVERYWDSYDYGTSIETVGNDVQDPDTNESWPTYEGEVAYVYADE